MNDYTKLLEEIAKPNAVDYISLLASFFMGGVGIYFASTANKMSSSFNEVQKKHLNVSPLLEEFFYTKLEELPDLNYSKETKVYLKKLIFHVESVYETTEYEEFREKFRVHANKVCDYIADKELKEYQKMTMINEESKLIRQLLRNKFFE
ncbi:hypothetical protein R2F61_07965 [Mollicutes bacterium LVI A0078]|nr:hypothetical protein RZE84_07740 [Mollicutes bacterium LVI A0075]WOO90650.1 hypothetical protein R2F61_07965 [Mollicutes bacterium LVI A0078]